ncbi:transposase [Streptomyces sp. NPDC057910]|uniref:transposase n=1 Tax=Streptomyces sp. NPDC057910 TaxID=3346278 RepID=UPI0036ED0343
MPLTDVERLDEIPGAGVTTAQVILAGTGTDMPVFPTADHLASWARPGPTHLPVRPEEHLRPHRQGQPLAARGPGRSRGLRSPHRHLPRRPLPPHRQTQRPSQGPGRRRPFHPRLRLAPPEPHRPLPRTRKRLAHPPDGPRPQDPRPRPPAHRPRPRRHPHPGSRLTHHHQPDQQPPQPPEPRGYSAMPT